MTESSPRQRKWPSLVLIAVMGAALMACLLLAGYLALPKLVTDRLPVAQIQRLGFADFTGRVSRIGLRQTAAGPLVFGHPDQPALAIQSTEIDYTLGELRRKKIRSIRISDVTVNGTLGPDGFVMPGLNPGNLSEQESVAQSPPGASSPLAGLLVERIEIRSGMVNLTWRDATRKIPFEADLTPVGRDMTNLDLQLRLFFRDQRLVLNAQIDVENRKARVSLDGSFIALDRFADLIHLIPGLDATGKVAVQAKAALTLTPLSISDANADLTWRSGRLAYASVAIEPEQDELPASLSVASADLEVWQIRANGMQLQTPAPVAMKMLAATVRLGGEIQTVTGTAELSVRPFSIEQPRPASLKTIVSMPLKFDISQNTVGDWTAAIGTIENNPKAQQNPVDITVAGVSILTDPPRFSLTATGDEQGGTATWQLNLNTLRAGASGVVVKLTSTDARGQLQLKQAPHGPVWDGDARIHLPGPAFDGNGITGKLDALTLSAQFQQQGSDAPVVNARMRASNGQFHHKDSGLQLSGVRLDLPFRSGPQASDGEGTFSVDRIVHEKRTLGKIVGRIIQKRDAYALKATHASDLFPGMTAVFTGTVFTKGPRLADADLSFQIPSYQLPAESDLGRFVPAAKGVTLSGMLSAQGKASISSNGISGDLDLAMQGGALRMAENKIAVEGIDMTLRFPELPRIRSGPAQQIRFSRAAMGNIVADGGTLDGQVESANTLFIEKGRLNWCGGKVDAGSLRITAGKQDYQVSLYCQRLGLSRILEQLGSVNATGTGTVNGRIPIVYRNGNIRFDDGFLFSTPGEAGRIQLTGTDMLTRGIPAGTPQFAQVELAQAALKDYAYDWAKLGLVSEGEDFVMRLQFDGKPANPLPFVYRKEIGSFVRVEVGTQGSVFQGIGLDVNLRLPLNQLLQYKGVVNMIQ